MECNLRDIGQYYHEDQTEGWSQFPGKRFDDGTLIGTLLHEYNLYLCIEKCETDPACQSFNWDETICSFLDRTATKIKMLTTDKNSIFFTKKPQCSGYCENLRYLNLCGKCSCVSTCGLRMPYYCNCTQFAPEKDCHDHLNKTGNKPGLYKINPDGVGEFPVYCELLDGKGWITFFRRGDENSDRIFHEANISSYYNGFGIPYDNYWLGLEYVHRITQAIPSSLTINFIGNDKVTVHPRSTFFNFKVFGRATNYNMNFGSSQGTHGIKYMKIRRKTYFRWCKNGDKVWWTTCKDGLNPTSLSGIYFGYHDIYSKVSFLIGRK